MLSLFRYSVPTRSSLCLFAILALSVAFPCNASTPPVPVVFQDLYTSLNSYLDSFNTTLNSQWNGASTRFSLPQTSMFRMPTGGRRCPAASRMYRFNCRS